MLDAPGSAPDRAGGMPNSGSSAAPSSQSNGEQSSRTSDPLVARNFKLEVDNQTIGYFTEVTGLGVEVEVETVAEGGQNQYEWKLPGRLQWSNLILKRGVTNSKELFEWLERSGGDGFSGNSNSLEMTTGRISMMSTKRDVVITWSFVGGFPIKWTGPTLSANGNEVATEELEIAHHGLYVE